MNRVLSDKKAILIFILPALIIFLGMIIIPIVMSGYYSTLQWDGIGKGIFVGLRNYKDLLFDSSNGFWQAILNSVILALLSIFIQLPIALILALILASGIKGEGFFRTVYFIPVIISTVVIGQLWMKIYHPNYGVLNSFLTSIGLGKYTHAWLGEMSTALMAVFIPSIWQYVGYHMLLMYAAIKSVPKDVIEAAKIDGASGVQAAFKITIPLIRPILEVCVVFAAIGSLKAFDLIYVLTNGGPLHATDVPSIVMFNTIFHDMKYGYGSSIAIFIVAECLLFTVLIRKAFNFRKSADS